MSPCQIIFPSFWNKILTLGTFICKKVTYLWPFLTMCTGPNSHFEHQPCSPDRPSKYSPHKLYIWFNSRHRSWQFALPARFIISWFLLLNCSCHRFEGGVFLPLFYSLFLLVWRDSRVKSPVSLSNHIYFTPWLRCSGIHHSPEGIIQTRTGPRTPGYTCLLCA